MDLTTHQEVQCLFQAPVNKKGTILLRDNTWLYITTNNAKVEKVRLQNSAVLIILNGRVFLSTRYSVSFLLLNYPFNPYYPIYKELS